MKIHSSVKFWKSSWHKKVDFDTPIQIKTRTFKQDLGVMWRSFGTLDGYWHLVFLNLLITMTYGSLGILVPFLDKFIIDDIVPVQNWNLFWLFIGFILLNDIIGNVFRASIGHFTGTSVMAKLGLWLQARLYYKIQRLSLAMIERKGIGELMYRMHKDAAMVTSIAWGFVSTLIGELYMLIIFVAFMSAFDPFLLKVVAVYEVISFFALNYIATLKQKVDFYSRRAKELSDGRMQEGFAGIETIKSYGRIYAECAAFIRRVSIQLRVEMLRKMLYLVDHTVFQYSGFFPWWRDMGVQLLLFYQVIHGEITYGVVIATMAYMVELRKPIEKIIGLWVRIRLTIVPLERYLQVYEAPSGVTPPKNPIEVPALKGRMDIQDVHFSYDTGVEVLHGVSLKAEPGEFIAIVGPSGSGKSTLLNLMIRLSDPSSGQVLADGIDIRNFDPSYYQGKLGIVMQETFLSKESLRWNLLLGDYYASDEDMIAALEACRLKPWFEKLPNGLDSYLDEGSKVSVGEKQRLGVVRAILRKSRLLFLDEPTSSLDLDTEKDLMEVIHSVRQNKTTIMITHRLSTIENADKIFVMKQGLLVESGKHAELMDKGGVYHHLLSLYRNGNDAA